MLATRLDRTTTAPPRWWWYASRGALRSVRPRTGPGAVTRLGAPARPTHVRAAVDAAADRARQPRRSRRDAHRLLAPARASRISAHALLPHRVRRDKPPTRRHPHARGSRAR